VTEIVLTPSQTSGPLFGFCLLFAGSDRAARPDSADGGTGRDATVCLEGTVVDGTGRPFARPRGLVEVWHGDQWARARTDGDGAFRVYLRRPAPGQAPDGQFLAPYFNIAVFGVGLLKQRVTRVYFPDEQAANRKDAVLQLVPEEDREKLLGTLAGDGTLQFEIVLQGSRETPTFGW
jgi:protocatechuate 3,4-dioxygenase alpha subunit